jgi:hypothetical protein
VPVGAADRDETGHGSADVGAQTQLWIPHGADRGGDRDVDECAVVFPGALGARVSRIGAGAARLAEAKGDSGFQQVRIAALEKQLAKLTKEVFGPSTEQRPAGTEGDKSKGDKSKDDEKKKRGHGPTK